MAEKWRFDLTMNSVRDLIDPLTDEVWSEAKKRRSIRNSLEVEGEFIIGRSRPDIMGFRQRTLTPISHLLRQWRRFEQDVGEQTINIASEASDPNIGQFSETSLRMMRNMGWVRGQGLGRNGQGTPHPPQAAGQFNRAGLGFGKLPTKPPSVRNPLLGFENEHGEIFYGYKGERNGLQVLEEVRCTGRGLLVHTNPL